MHFISSSHFLERYRFRKSALNENVISLSPNGKPYNYSGESLAVYPNINYGSGQQKDQITRGEYLVKLGDCVACHTHKGGQPFAGGLGFNTPFGIIYSSNITPDKKNGIGNWSFKQFKDAVTQGIGPHYYLYPAFPYIYFNKITDQDLKDIKAYLDVIPAVDVSKPKNQMIFPFNWRFLQFGWRLLFFEFQKTDGFHYNSHHDPEWNRGAYLVLGLGHCDMCHTPMYHFFSNNIVLGAPIGHRHLSGTYVSGFYAPNITQLFMKDLNYDDFKKIFLNYRLKEGGPVQGPMYQAIHDSLQYLQEPDLRAIYVYLSSVKSATSVKPKNHGKNIGEAIYDRYCDQCHQKGKGPINNAPKINDTWAWISLRKSGIEELLWYTMNGMDGMPIKGTCTDCTEEELKETIEYMLSKSIPKNLVFLPQTTNGQQIYQKYCDSCHNGSNPNAPKIGDQAAWKALRSQGMNQLILSVWTGKEHHPPQGTCDSCNLADISAAVKYLVDQSSPERDYQLW